MRDQLLVGASPGDAITQSALLLRAALRQKGPADIFSGLVECDGSYQIRPLEELRQRENCGEPLIFHACFGSSSTYQALLDEDDIVLVYHNFAPSEAFNRLAPHLVPELERGRWELDQIRDRVRVAIADSEFNAAELRALRYDEVQVIPPTPDLGRLDVDVDPETERQLDSWCPEGPLVLCVAQLLPHKRVERVIAAVAAFQQLHAPKARLAIVGKDRLPVYSGALEHMAETVGLVEPWITGRVSDAALATFYRRADVFLTLSDHEGFCIPVVEAMHAGVPVVASQRAALPETIGDAGVLIDDADDAPLVAGVLNRVVSDSAVCDILVARGRHRAREFDLDTSLAALLAAVTSSS